MNKRKAPIDSCSEVNCSEVNCFEVSGDAVSAEKREDEEKIESKDEKAETKDKTPPKKTDGWDDKFNAELVDCPVCLEALSERTVTFECEHCLCFACAKKLLTCHICRAIISLPGNRVVFSLTQDGKISELWCGADPTTSVGAIIVRHGLSPATATVEIQGRVGLISHSRRLSTFWGDVLCVRVQDPALLATPTSIEPTDAPKPSDPPLSSTTKPPFRWLQFKVLCPTEPLRDEIAIILQTAAKHSEHSARGEPVCLNHDAPLQMFIEENCTAMFFPSRDTMPEGYALSFRGHPSWNGLLQPCRKPEHFFFRLRSKRVRFRTDETGEQVQDRLYGTKVQAMIKLVAFRGKIVASGALIRLLPFKARHLIFDD